MYQQMQAPKTPNSSSSARTPSSNRSSAEEGKRDADALLSKQRALAASFNAAPNASPTLPRRRDSSSHSTTTTSFDIQSRINRETSRASATTLEEEYENLWRERENADRRMQAIRRDIGEERYRELIARIDPQSVATLFRYPDDGGR